MEWKRMALRAYQRRARESSTGPMWRGGLAILNMLGSCTELNSRLPSK
jgi:hypothetical protein